jgi:beta-galactosidase
MAGCFVWTGLDYKGEPTPYAWPCINSHFGIMDICGFPKDTYYYYQAWWSDKTVLHLLPHWNWPGKEGEPIDVWCHSNCDEVELALNGKSLGRQTMPRNGHLQWKVPYAPGKLEANGFRGGQKIAAEVVETTGTPAKLRLTPDRTIFSADGEDVILVRVAVLDEKDRVVPTADNEVQFAVQGAGQIAGVGNGDPSSHEPDKAAQRHAFGGLALVIVRATEKAGKVELNATAAGLQPAQLTLRSESP